MASLYHCSIVTGMGCSSVSLIHKPALSEHLNSTTNGYPSYPASKAAFSKSWTCSSANLSLCCRVLILSDCVVLLSVSPNFWSISLSNLSLVLRQRFDPMSQRQVLLYLSVLFCRPPSVRSVYDVNACPFLRSIKHSDEPSLIQDTWFEIVQ